MAEATPAIFYLVKSFCRAISWAVLLMASLMATGVLCVQDVSIASYHLSKPASFATRSPAIDALAVGKYLIASRNLSDSNFSETVVLLIHYDGNGAMGLTINVPSEFSLAEAFPDLEGLQKKTELVFIGGPVMQNRMFLLLQADEDIKDARRVVADIYVSTSRSLFEQLANDQTSERRWRLYVGYAGWKAGQLENEVARGDWHILPADAETIFNTPPNEIWPTLIQQGPVKWLWLHVPSHTDSAG